MLVKRQGGLIRKVVAVLMPFVGTAYLGLHLTDQDLLPFYSALGLNILLRDFILCFRGVYLLD